MLGIPGAWKGWYTQVYEAVGVQSNAKWIVYFITFGIHWVLCILIAVAVPSFNVIEPAVVRSTIDPLPLVVRMSLCAASVTTTLVPAALNSLTLTATSSTELTDGLDCLTY